MKIIKTGKFQKSSLYKIGKALIAMYQTILKMFT